MAPFYTFWWPLATGNSHCPCDENEFQQLGPDEYFESDGLVLIEWADRVAGPLPRDYVEIRIEVTGVESRRFEIRAVGQRYEEMLRRLAPLFLWERGRG